MGEFVKFLSGILFTFIFVVGVLFFYQTFVLDNYCHQVTTEPTEVKPEVKPVAEVTTEVKPVGEVTSEVKPVAEVTPEVKPVAEVKPEVNTVGEVKPEVHPVGESPSTIPAAEAVPKTTEKFGNVFMNIKKRYTAQGDLQTSD